MTTSQNHHIDATTQGVFSKVDHVQVPVHNVEEATTWYVDNLGFICNDLIPNERAVLHLSSGPSVWLWQTDDQTTTTFTLNGKNRPAIGFLTNDIQGMYERLQRAQARIVSFEQVAWGTFLEFFDPDGNMLLIHQD